MAKVRSIKVYDPQEGETDFVAIADTILGQMNGAGKTKVEALEALKSVVASRGLEYPEDALKELKALQAPAERAAKQQKAKKAAKQEKEEKDAKAKKEAEKKAKDADAPKNPANPANTTPGKPK